MGFAKLTKFALVAIVTTSFLSTFASAQPIQKPLRWLGQGYSAGYHRCNPGPDTSYYNPWNAHNSMLISNLPQFQNQNFQSFDTSNLSGRPIYQGVPFSVYAAPKSPHNYGYDHGMHQQHTSEYEGASQSQSVESSFEPYNAEDEEESEFDEEDQWNDDSNEWNDDNQWEEEGDDSARIQSPVPASPFSNASFPKQRSVRPEAAAQPAGSGQGLFNPFPELNPGQ